jgi:hypothetical protein
VTPFKKGAKQQIGYLAPFLNAVGLPKLRDISIFFLLAPKKGFPLLSLTRTRLYKKLGLLKYLSILHKTKKLVK